MERYGIDVSHHQGAIDWAKVKSAKIQALDKTTHPVEFAFIRAGISYWAGGLKRDEQFDGNMAQAMQQGIPVGVYVYSYTKTPEAILSTADLMVKIVDNKDVPIVLDLEDAEVYAPLGRAKTTAIAKAFVDRVKAAGRPVILYTYTFFAQAHVDLSVIDCPKWIADYRGYCGVQNPDIWQYSSKGQVDGIGGNVDLNVSYTDKFPLLGGKEETGMKGVRYIGDFNDALTAAIVCTVVAKGGHTCEVVPYGKLWGVLVTQLKPGVSLGDFVSAVELLSGFYNCDPKLKK